MTKMNFFEFIFDFLVKNSDKTEGDAAQLIIEVKTVIDCLTPLKLTLETMSMEQITMASLIRPLTSQLLHLHFTLNDGATDLENEFNAIIHKELKNTQSPASSFLMQSSFLDPRFQSLQSAEDVATIKCALKKLNDADPDVRDPLFIKKEKSVAVSSPVNKQKSVGLKFFFSNKEQKATPNNA
ncbi:uncharacterized protein LOC119085071 [Bradysia coprophila]|uniref:uncharacterized protein LOC119085071 n=1 Tax=Bradysia coprophila TaxID=38358 RepID=UPI00187D81E5|nr:uncharacterized protein LOC119085071 [Bradysia coprophila]